MNENALKRNCDNNQIGQIFETDNNDRRLGKFNTKRHIKGKISKGNMYLKNLSKEVPQGERVIIK